jgi:hypothetical protein
LPLINHPSGGFESAGLALGASRRVACLRGRVAAPAETGSAQLRKMKYAANIHAGDVTITVKHTTRVMSTIASGHCIPASPASFPFILYISIV